ncbi:hypothetical protein UY3_00272 [Chelonia mydas]|uniref:Uncharacterized protein n=1 Tax=Chelonia mydas TaxID=8469 RepID=M7CCJ5_CHEMY|nr:hypothetical protein UY3_00272 [Chelonia mydas]
MGKTNTAAALKLVEDFLPFSLLRLFNNLQCAISSSNLQRATEGTTCTQKIILYHTLKCASHREHVTQMIQDLQDMLYFWVQFVLLVSIDTDLNGLGLLEPTSPVRALTPNLHLSPVKVSEGVGERAIEGGGMYPGAPTELEPMTVTQEESVMPDGCGTIGNRTGSSSESTTTLINRPKPFQEDMGTE